MLVLSSPYFFASFLLLPYLFWPFLPLPLTVPLPSKNLIYLIQCKKCHCQYIGETKRQLSERFEEHRRSILNHHQLSNRTPVSLHFNQPGHSINDVHLIPLELIRSKRDSVRKAREAHLIIKAKTLLHFGINRPNEARK